MLSSGTFFTWMLIFVNDTRVKRMPIPCFTTSPSRLVSNSLLITRRWLTVCPPSTMVVQYQPNIGSAPLVYSVCFTQLLLNILCKCLEKKQGCSCVCIPSRHKTLNQCWLNAGPPLTTLGQRVGPTLNQH